MSLMPVQARQFQAKLFEEIPEFEGRTDTIPFVVRPMQLSERQIGEIAKSAGVTFEALRTSGVIVEVRGKYAASQTGLSEGIHLGKLAELAKTALVAETKGPQQRGPG